jgi:hypothetical protein
VAQIKVSKKIKAIRDRETIKEVPLNLIIRNNKILKIINIKNLTWSEICTYHESYHLMKVLSH